jgi:hypothetical protein
MKHKINKQKFERIFECFWRRIFEKSLIENDWRTNWYENSVSIVPDQLMRIYGNREPFS